MRKNKIRASYSFLHEWSKGNIKQALLGYFHVPHPTPSNYVNGKKWDTYATEYIEKHSKLPPEWGGNSFGVPVCQLKTLMPYNSLSTITGVYDVYDHKTQVLTELKSGHSYSARQYAATMQIPLYLLVAEIAKIPIKRVDILRYNPQTDSCDRAVLIPNDRIIGKARNHLDTWIPEIHQYFETMGLFNKTEEEMAKLLE